jgi:glycogen synthase
MAMGENRGSSLARFAVWRDRLLEQMSPLKPALLHANTWTCISASAYQELTFPGARAMKTTAVRRSVDLRRLNFTVDALFVGRQAAKSVVWARAIR